MPASNSRHFSCSRPVQRVSKHATQNNQRSPFFGMAKSNRPFNASASGQKLSITVDSNAAKPTYSFYSADGERSSESGVARVRVVLAKAPSKSSKRGLYLIFTWADKPSKTAGRYISASPSSTGVQALALAVKRPSPPTTRAPRVRRPASCFFSPAASGHVSSLHLRSCFAFCTSSCPVCFRTWCFAPRFSR